MSAGRLTAIGILAFVLCAIVFAPASLLRPALDRVPGLAVTELGGSLWRGAATVGFRGVSLGRLRFTLRPQQLLQAQLGYDIEITGPLVAIAGQAAAGMHAYRLVTSGGVDLELIRPLLARYDLVVPGRLKLTDLDIAGRFGTSLPNARGEARWNGGEVAYRLSGRSYRSVLPELSGILDSSTGHPQMTVYAVTDSTPLLMAHVTQDGMASVGITKQFTKLVGLPWGGSEPDHAVVLEVAEKLF